MASIWDTMHTVAASSPSLPSFVLHSEVKQHLKVATSCLQVSRFQESQPLRGSIASDIQSRKRLLSTLISEYLKNDVRTRVFLFPFSHGFFSFCLHPSGFFSLHRWQHKIGIWSHTITCRCSFTRSDDRASTHTALNLTMIRTFKREELLYVLIPSLDQPCWHQLQSTFRAYPRALNVGDQWGNVL